MPRSRRSGKRPYGEGHRPLDMDRIASVPRGERGADGGDYTVSRISGNPNTYTCPGCLQQIPPFTPHVVAWRAAGAWGVDVGVDARRHWHSECWRRGLRPN